MRNKTFLGVMLWLMLLCLLAGCEKRSDNAVTGGSFTYKGERYLVKQARFEWQGDYYDNHSAMLQLTLSPATLKVNETGISGYGAMIELELVIDSTATTIDGEYLVSSSWQTMTMVPDSSQMVIYLQDKSDTIYMPITGGYLEVLPNALGRQLNWRLQSADGDSIIGNWQGQPVYNTIVTPDSLGYLVIADTIPYALAQGTIFNWGELFQEGCYYYEIYLYSTTMTRSDAGAYKDGFYLVLGVQSSNAEAPESGTYPVSRFYDPGTLLYGNRQGKMNWGSYWQVYKSGSISEIGRAHV